MAFSFVKCLSNSLSDVTKGYYLWCLRILFETPMSGRFRSQNDPTSARHRECIYSRCYITFRTSASRRYNVGGRCYIAFRRRRLVGIASGVDAISHVGRRRLVGTTSGVVNTSHFSIGADAGPLRWYEFGVGARSAMHRGWQSQRSPARRRRGADRVKAKSFAIAWAAVFPITRRRGAIDLNRRVTNDK